MAGDDISPEQAHESHQRLVDHYFGNPAERPRIHIPARPTKDDDLVVSGYIDQSVARIAALESELAQLRREKEDAEDLLARVDKALLQGHYASAALEVREAVKAAFEKAQALKP